MAFGISVALLTPFAKSGAINTDALAEHARDLLGRGIDGVTLFGTTGEGASIGGAERAFALQALLDAGVSAEKITLGICATSLPDAIAQVTEGVGKDVRRFLVLPPFYFKGCSDDGLFDWHAQLMAATPSGAEFILYHIPQLSGVPLSVDLVARLKQAAPDRVMAIKDSAGQWDYTEALLDMGALDVLVGDERHLARALRMGASGSICGTANLYPERLAKLFSTREDDPDLSQHVSDILLHPVVPALKALQARMTGDPEWRNVRVPLQSLEQDLTSLN